MTEVTGIKKKGGEEFVGVDTGMHHIIRPVLLDAHHRVLVANDLDRKPEGEKNVVGPVCSSIDVIAESRKLPEINEGDIISIEDIGAYGFTMSSHWNSRPLPPEVLVDDGETEIIRESENLDDIFHGTELEN